MVRPEKTNKILQISKTWLGLFPAGVGTNGLGTNGPGNKCPGTNGPESNGSGTNSPKSKVGENGPVKRLFGN